MLESVRDIIRSEDIKSFSWPYYFCNEDIHYKIKYVEIAPSQSCNGRCGFLKTDFKWRSNWVCVTLTTFFNSSNHVLNACWEPLSDLGLAKKMYMVK